MNFPVTCTYQFSGAVFPEKLDREKLTDQCSCLACPTVSWIHLGLFVEL